jgi:uncharacterized protein (DUF2236 family)
VASSVLPSDQEAAALAVGPDSITWRRAGDARLLMSAGAALVLQVSHPTVGAGVGEHSNFAEDPWGRLVRTLDYTNLLVYGGAAQAPHTARQVRDLHKEIKGVKPDGSRYHALEPEAYAWVHATLAEMIVLAHARFGRPMRREQVERFYGEWRGLGRLLGVRERDLPETWAGFREYFDEMVHSRLEDNDVVQEVLSTLLRPARPPLPLLNDTTWKVARLPIVRATRLATAGLLPAALRKKLRLRWTAANEAELRAIGAIARATTPVLPRDLREMGPRYLRMRGEELTFGASTTRPALD